MRIALGLLAGLGGLSTVYWFARFIDLAGQPNGGLAATFALNPLGYSACFMAVCMAGAGVMQAIEGMRSDLLKQMRAGSPVQPVAIQRSARVEPTVGGEGRYVNPRYAPGGEAERE